MKYLPQLLTVLPNTSPVFWLYTNCLYRAILIRVIFHQLVRRLYLVVVPQIIFHCPVQLQIRRAMQQDGAAPPAKVAPPSSPALQYHTTKRKWYARNYAKHELRLHWLLTLVEGADLTNWNWSLRERQREVWLRAIKTDGATSAHLQIRLASLDNLRPIEKPWVCSRGHRICLQNSVHCCLLI